MGLAQWGGVCRQVAAAAVIAVGVAAATVVGVTGPAAASVQAEAGDFHRLDAAQLEFVVTNTNPSLALTKVELQLPEKYPVPEVYPMSHENWAPQLTMRPVSQALTDRHGGTVDQVVSTVTWWAMPGVELAPGATSTVRLSLWVLPEVDRFEFTVVETFADNSVATSTTSIAVGPALAATDEAGGDGGAADDTAATDPAGSGTSNMWWMFGLLILIGAVTAFALTRQRKGTPSVDNEDAGRTARPAAKKTAAVKKTAAAPKKRVQAGR